MYVNKSHDLQLNMSDESLLYYVNESPYKNDLLQIPIINQRIQLYEKYENFDLSLFFNKPFKPYVIFKIKDYKYDIKIVKDNSYVYIQYKYDKNNIRVLIQNVLDNYVIDIDYDAMYGFDIHTIYTIYINQGLCKYAKKATKDYLTRQYNKISDDLYNLMGLYLWFKINCIFLYLTNESLIDINQEIPINYINTQEGIDTINKFKNHITLYYDLLSQYIENL